MSVIRIENFQEMPCKEFQQILQEAWENGSPLDDLLEIIWQLAELEQKYDMKSADFIEKFRRGEMGDEMDFIWWASIYDLYLGLRERIERALIKPTFPHHKHVDNRVEPCQEPDLQDVLREIDARLYPQPAHS